MSERRETDPLAATAVGTSDEPPTSTPALDATQVSGDELPPITGLVAGDRVGRFEILHLLGAGGMGAVFAARDTELRRKVAIKVLRRARAGSQGSAMSARLLREAQAAARLSHRNVVTIYEVGTIEKGTAAGQVFVAMELVEGETLTRWHDRRPPWRDAVRVYLGAARGLAAAHAAGLVHRDFKPDNALLAPDGEVKVMDFGLASVAGERVAPATASATPRNLEQAPTRLTSTGDVMGTPLFMAPEQRDGGVIDARADQFALCVALFRTVYRAYPYGMDSEAAIAARARKHEVATPRRLTAAPRALYKILHRGLSPDPADRFPDLPALIRALERVVGARRRMVIAGTIGGAILGVAAVAVFAGRRSAAVEPCTGAAAELAATWNPAVAKRMEQAILAHELPGAARMWSRTDDVISRWGDGWIAARTSTCRATQVEGSQSPELLDRRMACLDRQRQLLAGTVALLERPDRDAASRAAEIAFRLPRPEECANAAPVSTGSEEIRATLRDLQIADLAGKFSDQLGVAKQVLADTRALGDHVLEAEAGLQYGRFQRMAGDDDAAATMLDTIVAAESSLQFDIAVRAWAEWIYIASSTSDTSIQQIQGVYEKAELALHRAGDDPVLTALLRNNQGVAAYQFEHDDDAERLLREALTLREGVFGPDHPRIAEVLDNLGNVLASQGNHAKDPAETRRLLEAALAAGQRGLEIRQRAFGDANPAVARSLHNVGSTLYDLERFDEAQKMLRQALTLKEEVLGKDHPDLGTTLLELSQAEERLGNLEEAVVLSSRTLALWRATEGRNLTYALASTARRLVALGRFDEAIAQYEEAAALTTSAVRAANYRRFAAEARIEAGDVKTALADLRAVVGTEAEAYALGDVKRAPSLITLAWAEVASGRPEDALHSLARAEKLMIDSPRDSNVEIIALTKGEAYLQLGKKAEGTALIRKALACDPARCTLDLYMIKRRAAKLGVTP